MFTARHQQTQAKADRRIAWRYVSWVIGEAEKWLERVRSWEHTAEADLPSRLAPSPEPKAYLRARGPRRERIKAMVPALMEERRQRVAAQERKRLKDLANAEPPRQEPLRLGQSWRAQSWWGDRGAPATPHRAPAWPASAGAAGRETVTEILDRMRREAKREAKRTGNGTGTSTGTDTGRGTGKRRGRPRLTEAEKRWRRLKRAAALQFRVMHEGQAYDVAWRALRPGSTATHKNATRAAKKDLEWLETTYQSRTEAAFQKYGLWDVDFFVRRITEGLAATLVIRGKPTDIPDWRARREALKLLMIGLELAMLRGFRSGPRALGGVLEDAPIAAAADIPPGDDDSDAYALRRFKAEGIFIRHVAEGLPLADCWFAVNPDSKANRKTAAQEAARMISWMEQRLGSPLMQRLIAEGLDNITVLDGINDLLNATTRFGGPDRMIRHHGIELLMLLHGFHRKIEDIPVLCFNVLSLVPDAELKSFFEELELSPEELELRESAREKQELSPEEQRVHNAERLILHSSHGLPPEQCWKAVYRDSDASAEKARELVDAEIEWCRRNHPIPMKRLLFLRGMDADFLVRTVIEQANATVDSNIRVLKGGRIVRRYHEPTDFPDNRTRFKALRQIVAMSKAGGRALERSNARSAQQAAARGNAA